MTRRSKPRPRLRGLLGALTLVALPLGLGALPAAAGAYAAIAPQATFSSSPGLPDSRVFEQVSPTNKDGNEAGGSNIGGAPPYIAGSPDGNGVLYFTNGPFGNAQVGVNFWTVSRRSAAGWSAYAAIPRGQVVTGGHPGVFRSAASQVFVSEDFSSVVYRNQDTAVTDAGSKGGLFMHGLVDGSVSWLTRPRVADPQPVLDPSLEQLELPGQLTVGGSEDFSTSYFASPATLVPEDYVPNAAVGGLSRADVVNEIGAETAFSSSTDFGFYEWHEGDLKSAGLLPDGSLDPYGAIPASQAGFAGVYAEYHPNALDNGVSEDGSRALFVSPDPFRLGGNCVSEPDTCGRAPELYVHETAPDGAQHSVLVSEDPLLPAINGLPAPAPTGPQAIRAFELTPEVPRSYMYASPDGSRVYFQSADRLTVDAPSNAAVKAYEFNVNTNALTYLQGVSPEGTGVAQILATSRDGASFIFEQRVGASAAEAAETPADAVELDLWSGGRVTPIMALNHTPVYPVKADRDGSAFAFVAPHVAGLNDGGGGQVVRYDVASDTLSCLSCPPIGVTPARGGVLGSEDNATFETGLVRAVGNPDRAISENGSRVLFQTANSLVPQDTNGVADVYEWENGTVFLISSGSSAEASYFGGISATGDDAFFSTSEGLGPGDADGGYDVYDARVPRPGDNPPVAAVPCSGDVCQGPPSVADLLSAPASATFNGLGNPSATPTVAKPKAKAKRKAKLKKKTKLRKQKGRKAQARKLAGAQNEERSSSTRKGNG